MKPIQLKKTVIDIPFVNSSGEEVLMLHFDRSQENIEKFDDVFKELSDKIEQLEKQDDVTWREAEDFVRSAMDSTLGEGAYDKVFEISPSINLVTTYFYQIAIGIKEELEAEDIEAIESKYLK